jgi:hypothetical protein
MRYVLLAALLLVPACSCDAASDTWKLNSVDSRPESDSLEHNLAVQHYMREHNGRMPPPDTRIYP